MYEDEFPLRLTQLRNKKGVSARDMSLSIGQNPGYINNIESGKAMPSRALPIANYFKSYEKLRISTQLFLFCHW